MNVTPRYYYLLLTTFYFSIKIVEDGEFDLASTSNGLTRVLPPNTPDLGEEEGCGEKGGPASNICTVMEPQPRPEQVTGVRTLSTRDTNIYPPSFILSRCFYSLEIFFYPILCDPSKKYFSISRAEWRGRLSQLTNRRSVTTSTPGRSGSLLRSSSSSTVSTG